MRSPSDSTSASAQACAAWRRASDIICKRAPGYSLVRVVLDTATVVDHSVVRQRTTSDKPRRTVANPKLQDAGRLHTLLALRAPAAHRRRRRARPRTAPPPEGALRIAAAERHRGPRRCGGRRGTAPCRAAGPRGRAGAARRRGRGRAPRRHLHRARVRRHPAGQHRRHLQPLRGGAAPRREAHRLRELEPRHRFLPAGRSDRRRTRRCGPTATTACRRPSARTWRSSTGTARASRP